MAFPFAADSWTKRGDVPAILINGTYSGIVTGLAGASYDPPSRTIQIWSNEAHHFNGYANTAMISFNDGQTWADTFNPSQDPGFNEVVVQAWSLPNPAGGSLHYQVRTAWQHAFFVFDGSVPAPGGMSLWASDGSATFSKVQDLESWPQINQIGGNLGRGAIRTYQSSATQPILIEGSGPDGEDAYWFITSYQHDGGGASNLTVFKKVSLWRSIDGGFSWENVRDLGAVTGYTPYASMHESSTGRIIIVQGASNSILYTDGDLLTGSFTASAFSGVSGFRGPLMPMFGGTWFTFSQGTLTGPGSAWISCDDATNFSGSDALIPQNKTGYGTKLGPTELLVVAPGFADPTTETASYYSDNGGEDFLISDPWIASAIGEAPVFIGIRSSGTPIVITSAHGVYVSQDTARGTTSTRNICTLVAGIATARPLPLCGGVITPDCQE